MKKQFSHRGFVEQLVAQESRIAAADLADHRQKLKQRIAVTHARERRMRMAVLCAAFLVVGMVSLFLALEMLAPPGEWPLEPLLRWLPDWARSAMIVILWTVFGTAAICLMPFALLYWLRYGRQARQTREDYILLALTELQQEVAQLRRNSSEQEHLEGDG